MRYLQALFLFIAVVFVTSAPASGYPWTTCKECTLSAGTPICILSIDPLGGWMSCEVETWTFIIDGEERTFEICRTSDMCLVA